MAQRIFYHPRPLPLPFWFCPYLVDPYLHLEHSILVIRTTRTGHFMMDLNLRRLETPKSPGLSVGAQSSCGPGAYVPVCGIPLPSYTQGPSPLGLCQELGLGSLVFLERTLALFVYSSQSVALSLTFPHRRIFPCSCPTAASHT